MFLQMFIFLQILPKNCPQKCFKNLLSNKNITKSKSCKVSNPTNLYVQTNIGQNTLFRYSKLNANISRNLVSKIFQNTCNIQKVLTTSMKLLTNLSIWNNSRQHFLSAFIFPHFSMILILFLQMHARKIQRKISSILPLQDKCQVTCN